MTDFYAIYFFIVLCIILFGLGLWFKYAWIFWTASIGWGMIGIYCLVEGYSGGHTYVQVLGMFCLALCIACTLAPMFIRKGLKPEDPPVKSRHESTIKRIEQRRQRSTALMPKRHQWWES